MSFFLLNSRLVKRFLFDTCSVFGCLCLYFLQLLGGFCCVELITKNSLLVWWYAEGLLVLEEIEEVLPTLHRSVSDFLHFEYFLPREFRYREPWLWRESERGIVDLETLEERGGTIIVYVTER